MFGYVVVNKPELKIREYDEYREYYCGLCHVLSQKHGLKSSLCLNYDYTFLLILLSGLYEPKEDREEKRCFVHPIKKQNIRRNKFSEYVADMGIVLARLKCMDDWEDEHNFVKKTYGEILKKNYDRIRNKYPVKVEIIEQCLMNIHRAEQENEKNIDVISGYFGKAFEEICAVYGDEWESRLRKMGFYLGKFIYILDAYDDVEKDIKDGGYNPFCEKCKDEGFDDYVYQILTLNAAECAREFETLPIINDVEILRNILYSGIWTQYTNARNRRNADEKSL